MKMPAIATAFVLIAAAVVRAAGPESPGTPIIAVVPDLNHLQKWDDMHGDTADPFWADDDKLYHFTCDGRGFGKQQRNFCFNKLTGPDLLQLQGTLVNSMDEYGKAGQTGPDGATWKVSGQECIDDVFYAFAVRNVYGHQSKDPLMRQTSFNASLINSLDRGLTWTRSAKENYEKPMWPGARFGAPSFVHYGANGGRVARDGADQFVYGISNNGFWNNGDDFILGRVRRGSAASECRRLDVFRRRRRPGRRLMDGRPRAGKADSQPARQTGLDGAGIHPVARAVSYCVVVCHADPEEMVRAAIGDL